MSEKDAIFRELAERIAGRPIEVPIQEMEGRENFPTNEQWQLIDFQVNEFLQKRLREGIKGCDDNALVKSIAESMVVDEYQLFSEDIPFDDKYPVDMLLNEITLFFRTILKEQGYETKGAFVTSFSVKSSRKIRCPVFCLIQCKGETKAIIRCCNC